MTDLQTNINRINHKLFKLVKQYLQLKKDNEKQSNAIKKLLTTTQNNQQTIDTLQQQVNILKASTQTMNDADKKNFEIILTQYIKEIDKCIGFLSQ